jgi:hypothetical protein
MTQTQLGSPSQDPVRKDDPRDRIVAAMSRVPVSRRRRARVVVVTVLSVLVVGYALQRYGGLDPRASRVGLRPGVPWQFPLLVSHILAGSVALALGPFQLVRWIRRRPRIHRYLGRAYLFAGVFPASVAGLGVATLTTAGPVAAVGFAVGDVAWFGTALLGYRAARARRYRDHERWMLRNLALTFAAVTFRVWLALLIVGQLPLLEPVFGGDFGSLFHIAYVTTTWLAFLPNVLVVDLFLRRRSQRAKAPIGSHAGSTVGSASSAASSSDGSMDFGAAISKTYSSNHESFIV